jgi:hypothetical protein
MQTNLLEAIVCAFCSGEGQIQHFAAGEVTDLSKLMQ